MVFQASPVGLVPLARLAEVEAAEQFADEEDVGAVDDLGAQRAVDGEFLEGEGRAEIGESAEGGADLKQSGFGALVGRKGIEFVAADGAEQNGVARERVVQVSAGSGVPSCTMATPPMRRSVKTGSRGRRVRLLRAGRDCFAGDFGADAVAGED